MLNKKTKTYSTDGKVRHLSTEEDINVKSEKIISKNKKEKKSINYLNILLVIIISITAFILVLDTFEDQLISIFPNIKFLLNNLYQSIEDIKLFIFDLIK